MKKLLCLDFDGVLHSYTSGWQGADVIPDPPVPGAMAFLVEAVKHFQVAIYSSRSSSPEGIDAMWEWLDTWLPSGGGDSGVLTEIDFPKDKPPAFVGLDDRVLTFTGEWPSMETLLNFNPWWETRLANTRPE